MVSIGTIAHALGADDAFLADFTARLKSQRDLLCTGLANLGFEVFVPEGVGPA